MSGSIEKMMASAERLDQLGAENGQHRLPRRPPSDWTPKYILYSQYTFLAEGGELRFQSTTWAVKQTNVHRFIHDLATSGPSMLGDPLVYRPGVTPLDVFVEDPCWMVIELDKAKDWQFRVGGPALTAKQDYGDDNWGLKHVPPEVKLNELGELELLSDHGPGIDECRIAFFGVVRRGAYEHQQFNVHIQLGQGGYARRLEIMIDPDFPDIGGGFPPLFGP
ncbi:nucleotide synthetase [Phenylobacterium sp.]|uniref:nucleotide synthetase n=1 Tax=Phenylobacterium sp. TaxID=1871053 RepID=UPI002FE27A39